MEFKKQFEAQSRDLFIQYHGQPEGYKTLVPHVLGFKSPDRAVTFIGVLMRIPPQAKDYIDTVYAKGKEVFEWGIRESKVQKVLSHQKTTVGAVPAVKSELIWGNGEHHINLTFHFPDAPSYGGTMLVIMQAETSKKYEKQVGHMLESVTLEKPSGEKN